MAEPSRTVQQDLEAFLREAAAFQEFLAALRIDNRPVLALRFGPLNTEGQGVEIWAVGSDGVGTTVVPYAEPRRLELKDPRIRDVSKGQAAAAVQAALNRLPPFSHAGGFIIVTSSFVTIQAVGGGFAIAWTKRQAYAETSAMAALLPGIQRIAADLADGASRWVNLAATLQEGLSAHEKLDILEAQALFSRQGQQILAGRRIGSNEALRVRRCGNFAVLTWTFEDLTVEHDILAAVPIGPSGT